MMVVVQLPKRVVSVQPHNWLVNFTKDVIVTDRQFSLLHLRDCVDTHLRLGSYLLSSHPAVEVIRTDSETFRPWRSKVTVHYIVVACLSHHCFMQPTAPCAWTVRCALLPNLRGCSNGMHHALSPPLPQRLCRTSWVTRAIAAADTLEESEPFGSGKP